MKLVTFTHEGVARVGVIDLKRQQVVDLKAASQAVDGHARPCFDSMLWLIESGEPGLDAARKLMERSELPASCLHRLDDTSLLSPLPRPTQLRDFSVFPLHLQKGPKVLGEITRELGGMIAPVSMPQGRYPSIYDQAPIFYFSNRMNVAGTGAKVAWPEDVRFLDFELELAICIGREAKNVSVERAMDHVFGYLIFNDVSSRDIQAIQMPGGLGPCKAKSYDNCNILGPWLVTKDEIADPYKLPVEVKVNGEVWNKSSTGGMLHSFADMIAFASKGETLYPGEVFGSGTVGGCCGLELERWIKAGDTVELSIEGLGSLTNQFGG